MFLNKGNKYSRFLIISLCLIIICALEDIDIYHGICLVEILCNGCDTASVPKCTFSDIMLVAQY